MDIVSYREDVQLSLHRKEKYAKLKENHETFKNTVCLMDKTMQCIDLMRMS